MQEKPPQKNPKENKRKHSRGCVGFEHYSAFPPVHFNLTVLCFFFLTRLTFFSILPWAMVLYPSLLTSTHSFAPFQSSFSNSALLSNSIEILTLHAVLFHPFIFLFLPIFTVVISFNSSEQQACPSHYNILPQLL